MLPSDVLHALQEFPRLDNVRTKCRSTWRDVGDGIGLFPVLYLIRAATKRNGTQPYDLEVARRVWNEYVLAWPHRINDTARTFSRNVCQYFGGSTCMPCEYLLSPRHDTCGLCSVIWLGVKAVSKNSPQTLFSMNPRTSFFCSRHHVPSCPVMT